MLCTKISKITISPLFAWASSLTFYQNWHKVSLCWWNVWFYFMIICRFRPWTLSTKSHSVQIRLSSPIKGTSITQTHTLISRPPAIITRPAISGTTTWVLVVTTPAQGWQRPGRTCWNSQTRTTGLQVRTTSQTHAPWRTAQGRGTTLPTLGKGHGQNFLCVLMSTSCTVLKRQ